MRIVPLVIFLVSMTLLAGCTVSPIKMAAETPELLEEEDTGTMCSAYNSTHAMPKIEAELERRGAVRPKFINDMRQNQIRTGMNMCEVLAARGLPGGKNKPANGKGVNEQWMYYSPNGNTQIIYFERGFVKSVQTI